MNCQFARDYKHGWRVAWSPCNALPVTAIQSSVMGVGLVEEEMENLVEPPAVLLTAQAWGKTPERPELG